MMGDVAAAGHSEDSDYEVRKQFDPGQDLPGLHALQWG